MCICVRSTETLGIIRLAILLYLRNKTFKSFENCINIKTTSHWLKKERGNFKPFKTKSVWNTIEHVCAFSVLLWVKLCVCYILQHIGIIWGSKAKTISISWHLYVKLKLIFLLWDISRWFPPYLLYNDASGIECQYVFHTSYFNACARFRVCECVRDVGGGGGELLVKRTWESVYI